MDGIEREAVALERWTPATLPCWQLKSWSGWT
jgi:hypothetical protein